MATVEAVKSHPAAERAARWARESGADGELSGWLGTWWLSFAEEPGACGRCGRTFGVGHLVMRQGHAKRGEPVPAFVHVACAGDLRPGWARDTASRRSELVRATKSKGETAQPTVSAAAKALGKLDPRACPRFRVAAADSMAPGKLATLRDAARSFEARATVVASVAPEVPAKPRAVKTRQAAKPREAAKPRSAKAPGLVLAGVECVACRRAGRVYGGYVSRECPGCGVVNGPDGRPLVEAAPEVEPAPVEVAPEVPATVLEAGSSTGSSSLPACVEDWLGKLVYSVKRDYARAYVLHLLNGADEPADPGTDWARKARWSASRVVAGVR